MAQISQEEHDWLDRSWSFLRRRPLLWIPALVLVGVLVIVFITGQTAAQPFATDPTERGQPLSNPDQHLHSLAIDPAHPGTVYLGSHYGLFTSTNDGHTWPEPRGRFNTLMITGLAVQPADGNVAFLGLEPNGGDFGQNGVYVSTNAGGTFTRVTDPPAIKAPVNRYLLAAGMAPHQWFVVYAGAGLYETDTDGQSWQLLRTLAHGDVLRTLAVTSAGRILIGGTFGVATSIDHGAHWVPSATMTSDTWAIAPSPADAQVLYATDYDGIFRSSDGGATFAHMSAALTPAPFPRLAPSAQHVGTLYALGGGQQVWMSSDGGATWAVRAQLSASNPQYLFVAPNNDQHLYVGFYTPALAISSADGGQTWQILAH